MSQLEGELHLHRAAAVAGGLDEIAVLTRDPNGCVVVETAWNVRDGEGVGLPRLRSLLDGRGRR